MSKVISHLAISMDGFVAGPNQSLSNPIGEGGLRLHDWHRPGARPESPGESGWDSDVDREAADAIVAGAGAFVMGRNMFGPGRGEWDESWQGWWGPEPPYHAPVFVLTHYAREPLSVEG